jgi:hypothetical protein
MSRHPLVPEAKPALDRFKTEMATEIGLKYYNQYEGGNKSSKLNGSIGGPVGGMMTKKMVEAFEKNLIDK